LIINCAGRVGGLYSQLNKPVDYLTDNIGIIDSIYSAAIHVQGKVRIINFASTCIFPVESTYPLTESQLHDGPPHESNESYSYAKRLTTVYARACFRQYGILSTTFILGNLFGPNDNFNQPEDAHVIPALMMKAHNIKTGGFKSLKMKGSGKPIREFLYSKDAADMVVKYIDSQLYRGEAKDNIYLYSNHEEITIMGLARLILDVVGVDKRTKIDVEDVSDPGQLKKPSRTSSALKELNPTLTEFRQALAETYEDMKKAMGVTK